jgi:hypothetical protein
MGQTISTIMTYCLGFYAKLEDTYELYFKKEAKKDYYSNDILLKDDGQKASILSRDDIDKFIKQNQKDTSNEYKMVKSIEMDEAESLTKDDVKNDERENIEQLHNEINLQIEDGESSSCDPTSDNIEDLKSSLFATEDV